MAKLIQSKLLFYRQCPKRLWLQVNRPDLNKTSAATQAKLNEGNNVRDLARQLHDLGFIKS